MRRFLSIRALALLFLGLIAFVSVGADNKAQPPKPPGPPPPQAITTKLEVTRYLGDQIKWETALIINAPGNYTFQWNTNAIGVTAAEWQIIAAPNGFGQPIPISPTIAASGVLQGPFAANAPYKFSIDFNPILPAAPSASAKYYWMRIVPQQGMQKLKPSSPVQLTYVKAGPAPTIDHDYTFFDRFEKNLRAGLDGKAVGYEYAICDGSILKKSGASGLANVAAQTPMTADRKMHVASMSKTITTAAVMKALEILQSQGKSVDIDSPVWPYLPTGWEFGPHMKELTFADLIHHSGGLRTRESLQTEIDGLKKQLSSTTSTTTKTMLNTQIADLQANLPGKQAGVDQFRFNGVRQIIKEGSNNTDWRTISSYHNANFSLFRIIIPYMLNPLTIELPKPKKDAATLDAEIKARQKDLQTAAPGEKNTISDDIKKLQAELAKLGNYKNTERITAELYVKFVKEKVFLPTGLTTGNLVPSGPADAVTYYQFNNTSATLLDADYTTALLTCGSDGWVLSAKEYGTFITGLRAGKVLAGNTKGKFSFDRMRNEQLGMWKADGTTGGANWNHNGGWIINGAGVIGDWMLLPTGVTVVVLVNSQGGINGLEDIIRTAWNKSY